MRSLILPAVAAMALSACNPEQSAQERAAAEQNVTSLVVATNDTTAIDAATGQAANMAADVDFMPELENAAGGNAAAPSPERRRANTAPPRTTAAEPRASEAADDDAPDTNTL